MGTYHEVFWESSYWGGSREQRECGTFAYYLPGRLGNVLILLDGDVASDVARAERAMGELNKEATFLHSTEGVARLLLRAEAVSSSYIEGLTVGARRLLRSEFNVAGDLWRRDDAAASILGNVRAMQTAIDESMHAGAVTVNDILGIHGSLCAGTPIEKHGGRVRTVQNWVGGSSYNPLHADYVPPAPEHVRGLLEDVAAFCNRDDLSPVLKAAIVHAQFESIHPFVDGNGRTGRALIHAVLRRDSPEASLVPPISLVMATHSKSYVSALNGYRWDDSVPGAAERGLNEWVSFFAGSMISACEEARAFEEGSSRLVDGWRKRLGRVRKGSALDILLDRVIGMPVFTVKSAANAIERSIPAATGAIDAMLESGIVREVSAKSRNRVFEAPEAIEQLNALERRLASPTGDTAASPPVRPVPRLR